MANAGVNFKFKDFAGQTSNFQVDGTPMNAGNIATQIGLAQALLTATEGITIGEAQTQTIVQSYLEITTAKPTNGAARRELKWLVRYHDDTTGEQERREIPCPAVDDEAIFESDGESLLLASGAGAAFVTAFENYARSAAGNAVVIDSVKVVGRNL